jgi:hypothetical protein
MAIWHLRKDWQANLPVQKKLMLLGLQVASLPQPAAIEEPFSLAKLPLLRLTVNENRSDYESEAGECRF